MDQTVRTYRVYEHVFPNGKRYIGITSQTLASRFGANGAGYKKCPKMYKAIAKFGWENVKHNLLHDGLTKDEAEAKEIELIARFNTTVDGYNIDHGGNTAGTHSEETKAKISLGNKGKIKPPLSDSARAKISAANSGSKNHFFGRHRTEDEKRAHSVFMAGNQYAKGMHHSEEFKKMKSVQMHDKYKDGGNPRCKRVAMAKPDGSVEFFASLRIAAASFNVSPATILKRIRNAGDNVWRYADE